MSPILWGILAIAVVFAGLTLASWLRRPKLPPLEPGTELPATPVQRLARWTLLLCVVPAIGAGWMVVHYGAETIYDDDGLRLIFTLLLLVIIAVFLFYAVRLKTWVGRADGPVDERDREILARAPMFQSGAMLLTLAAWMVGLIERFHAAGAVPLFYLYLVFWSCWAASLLALPLGVLYGYRRR
jgi:hypothetical protein